MCLFAKFSFTRIFFRSSFLSFSTKTCREMLLSTFGAGAGNVGFPFLMEEFFLGRILKWNQEHDNGCLS